LEEKIKHILFLSSWYPTKNKPYLGNFIQRQAKLLSSKYKVTVLHLSSEVNLKSIETTINEEGNLKEVIIYHPKGRNIFSKYYFLKMAFKEGLKSIGAIDFIQGNVLFPKGLQFSWAKSHFKCPLLLMEHSSAFHLSKGQNLSFKDSFTLSKVYPKVDGIVAVSEILKNELQPFFVQKPIYTLPNHIDSVHFKPNIASDKRDTIEFLHVSTLDERFKNPKGMIDACAILIKKGITNFHFTIICDEAYQNWELYSKKLNLSDYITFKGPFDWDRIASFYQKSDCFILFSNYETFSIVLAEAWSCGIPTITTSVGIAHNLNNELGILVEKNNTNELSEAMEAFILGKKTFDIAKIKRYAERFSEKEVLSRYDTILQSLTK